ncbi:endothelin-converting enzyme 1-like [Paramuricea clavata]|uniref:Endothelin-converting enzyme 1-like n=1 Tax=Paramuricea clavata TaxID=317549 RepID=A0A7D9J5Q1_PARCT|nr:endothelin-converting enzyme 1-like [Paramuricea clavata]
MSNQRLSLDKRTYTVTFILSLVLLVCIVRVFTGSKKDTKYDDLITTGGAIRRSLSFTIPSQKTTVCKTQECKDIAKYVKRSMNTSVDPCSNFYKFTCGGWIKRNPIPKTSSSFSTFAKLNSRVEKALRKIIEDKTGKYDNEYTKKAKTFYKSCMDLKSIDHLGAKPLVDLIRDVGSSKLFDSKHWDEKNWDLRQTLLKVQKKYASAGGPLFSVHVGNDPRNNKRHILEVNLLKSTEIL